MTPICRNPCRAAATSRVREQRVISYVVTYMVMYVITAAFWTVKTRVFSRTVAPRDHRNSSLLPPLI